MLYVHWTILNHNLGLNSRLPSHNFMGPTVTKLQNKNERICVVKVQKGSKLGNNHNNRDKTRYIIGRKY